MFKAERKHKALALKLRHDTMLFRFERYFSILLQTINDNDFGPIDLLWICALQRLYIWGILAYIRFMASVAWALCSRLAFVDYTRL